MKLCYLGNAASVHTQRWVKYFAGQGHEVHLICLHPPASNDWPGVKLHVLKVVRTETKFPAAIRQAFHGFNLPLVVAQIRRIINRLNPDIVHAHSVNDYGFLASLSQYHPLVVTAWGSDVLLAVQRSKLSKWSIQFALRKADSLTCDAIHLADRMVELGASREKIALIYFGTDTRKFHPDRRDDKLKTELQIKADAPIVISLRHLTPLYDVESLIQAAPLVLAEIPDARFVIAGDGEQRSYLENMAASLGISAWIRFVGRLSGEQLPRYLASSDVYVSTSLSDAGLAASTAEAMACEVPVVITDFGNNSDWVKEGEGGFLVPLKSPAALAEKIIYLLKHPQARKSFGCFNRQVIEERNNYYQEMAKVELIYQRLAQRGRA